MPMGRKVVIPIAGAYLAFGRDLIPDDIPILGGLDDLIVLVLAVEVFFDGCRTPCSMRNSTSLGSNAGRSSRTSPRSGA